MVEGSKKDEDRVLEGQEEKEYRKLGLHVYVRG